MGIGWKGAIVTTTRRTAYSPPRESAGRGDLVEKAQNLARGGLPREGLTAEHSVPGEAAPELIRVEKPSELAREARHAALRIVERDVAENLARGAGPRRDDGYTVVHRLDGRQPARVGTRGVNERGGRRDDSRALEGAVAPLRGQEVDAIGEPGDPRRGSHGQRRAADDRKARAGAGGPAKRAERRENSPEGAHAAGGEAGAETRGRDVLDVG